MSLADALRIVTKTDSSGIPSEANDVHMHPIPSDHDGEDDRSAQDPDEDMQDLFGEDADNKPDESTGHSDQGDLSESERRHREAMEYPEDDEPEPVVEQVLEANAAIPNIPVPRSSDGKHWVLRMPNFVKVDSKPFHPDTYVGPEQEDEELTAESLREKSMSIKLKVENTVRWRWVKDQHGQDRRQSNARVVRWSDGTLSLKLGKELFDITQTVDTSGAVQRQALGGPSQTQAPSTQPPASSTPQKPIQGQGLTYLVAQHKRAGILQCEALVTGYMSLRPTGMQSETHRMLVRAVGQKHNKVARLRMAPDPTMDPEREKMELLKMASKKTKRPRGVGEDDGFGGSRRRRQSYTRKRRGDDMWSDDEEEDVFAAGGSEDEFGGGGGGGGGDDRRKKRKSGGGEDVNPRKGPGEYQTDDFLVSDSEEEGDHDDSDDGGQRRRRKTRKHRGGEGDGEEDEADDLEKLEAKIDQQAAEERKRRSGKPGTEDAPSGVAAGAASSSSTSGAIGGSGSKAAPADLLDDAMDVESEEEEEDVAVRRAGTAAGNRKKRAIDLEEEEEEE